MVGKNDRYSKVSVNMTESPILLWYTSDRKDSASKVKKEMPIGV